MTPGVHGRRALILGLTGQDGTYLARHLLEEGLTVAGTARSVDAGATWRLERLGVLDEIELKTLQITDAQGVRAIVEAFRPHEIYNLAGQSSVGQSFQRPVDTVHSIVDGTLNVLEAVRAIDPEIRVFNAGSGDCFGCAAGGVADESTPMQPVSPYGAAKAAAHWLVSVCRQSYGLFACTGWLFNHESELRSDHFVSRKIVTAACRIAAGSGEVLSLGDLSMRRDWGLAPEYVRAMPRMLRLAAPDDFVIATGTGLTLAEFVAAVFDELGLDWSSHVQFDLALRRPGEIAVSIGNAAKARRLLGWNADSAGEAVPRMLAREAWDRMRRMEQMP